MILLLDNFDSFTYNLVDYFGQLNIECDVLRNDLPLEKIKAGNYHGVVLSPGPENPQKAGNLMAVLEHYELKLPILGICLGHQAIGEYFGAELVKAEKPMHGKISEIICTDQGMFGGVPPKTEIVRYHSLILRDLPPSLVSTATTAKGEIMAIKHLSLPIWGLQFHPEAILTTFGLKMLENWVETFQIK